MRPAHQCPSTYTADGYTAPCSLPIDHDGWQASEYARTDRAVGLMGYFRGWYAYPTVYHAIGDGWRLLAPPDQEEDGTWTWWLVRDVTRENATHPIGTER